MVNAAYTTARNRTRCLHLVSRKLACSDVSISLIWKSTFICNVNANCSDLTRSGRVMALEAPVLGQKLTFLSAW